VAKSSFYPGFTKIVKDPFSVSLQLAGEQSRDFLCHLSRPKKYGTLNRIGYFRSHLVLKNYGIIFEK